MRNSGRGQSLDRERDRSDRAGNRPRAEAYRGDVKHGTELCLLTCNDQDKELGYHSELAVISATSSTWIGVARSSDLMVECLSRIHEPWYPD